MKKIFLLLFLIILSPVFVNAQSYQNANYTGWTTSSDKTINVQNGFSYIKGIQSTFNLTGFTTFYFYNDSVETPEGNFDKVRFSILFGFSEQGFTGSNDFQVTTMSFAASLNMGSSRYFCDITGASNNTGFFTVECPVNHSKFNELRLNIFNPVTYTQGANSNNLFLGVSNIWTFVADNSAIDITDSLTSNSQKEINAANSNSQNEINAANTNSQNQITNANTNSQNQINAANSNSKAEIAAMNANSKAEVTATNQNTSAINNMNSTISNSEVDIDNSFFSGFDNNIHGLAGVITAPLQFIGSITSSTCSPLALPMGFGMPNVQLPCMREIYQQYFGEWYGLYRLITFGFVSYCISVQIFAIVKALKDPENDKIEVMEL